MLKVITLLLAGLISFTTNASECREVYYNNVKPVTVYQVDQELCHLQYIVGYNYILKMPLYSAQKLTDEDINADVKRKNSFHQDRLLPEDYRVSVSSYKHTGYSRGHLTPSADAGSSQEMWETFAMSNMVPQNQVNNGGVWKSIEDVTREVTLKYKESYVVTGAIFYDKIVDVKTLNVPEVLYKGVLVPEMNTICVFVSNNNSSGEYDILSQTVFSLLYNRTPFPESNYGCNKYLFKF